MPPHYPLSDKEVEDIRLIRKSGDMIDQETKDVFVGLKNGIIFSVPFWIMIGLLIYRCQG